MKFSFEKNLPYQTNAIAQVVDLFVGNKEGIANNGLTVGNKRTISDIDLKTNLEGVQSKLSIPLSSDSLTHFTIEMETGTGKTYTYLKTILELHKNYSFTKFIIIVPSVAIREGVLKTLEITKEHFNELYPEIKYVFFEYNSGDLVRVKDFVRSTVLQIMVMTLDSFNKDTNVLNNNQDSFGGKPIEAIASTNPIVIMDEPQNMESDLSKEAIAKLNPLACLRYSATHKSFFNLIYSLNPYDAYDLGLVKQIKVCSITSLENNKPYLAYLGSKSTKTAVTATVEAFDKLGNKKQFKIKSTKKGLEENGNLVVITGNKAYTGYRVRDFDPSSISISIESEGVEGVTFTINVNEKAGDEDRAKYLLIRETIKEHIIKENQLTLKGIKVLSLFFIDRVASYQAEDGWIKKYFLEAIAELKQDKTLDKTINSWGDISAIHGGYFAAKDSSVSKAEEKVLYDKILKDKEKLLSFEEPLRFIFSHSALREGWDNPNVFQICTLNETYSEIKKRQEIGRGLRLCVNQEGHRIYEGDRRIVQDDNVVDFKDNVVNLLTVFANESYDSFVEALQKEIEADTGINKRPYKIIDGNQKETKAKLKKDVLSNEQLINLFNQISGKTEYTLKDIEEKKLLQEIVEALNNDSALQSHNRRTTYAITKATVKSINESVVDKYNYEQTSSAVAVNAQDLLSMIASRTGLPKMFVAQIIKKLSPKVLAGLLIDKNLFLQKAIEIIDVKLREHFLNKSVYIKLNSKLALEELFEEEIKTRVEDSLIVESSNADNTIYDKIICDSNVERDFISHLIKRDDIKLAIKLPNTFQIVTPIGRYNPDWAIVKQSRVNNKLEYVYLVKETKSFKTEAALKEYSLEQWQKVQYGKLHFKELGFNGFSVVSEAKDI